MKDLKHLIYFESLLENANNERVQKAQAEGNLALGYTCYHVPEALLNVGNCFSVRLRAPHTTSMELATYYMANNSCEFSRAILERAREGHGPEDLARDLLADVLDAVGVIRIRDVEVGVEEFVLVRTLRVHDLHILDGRLDDEVAVLIN